MLPYTTITLLILSLMRLPNGHGEFLKISVDSNDLNYHRYKRTEDDRNICSKLTKVENNEFNLSDKFNNIKPFWKRKDTNVTLWRADPVLKERWEEVFQMRLRGVGGKNITVGDVMKHYADEGCLIVPWGGGPRDIILGAKLHDVDAEVSCDFPRAYNVCVDYVGEDSCQKLASVVRVGHPDDSNYTGPTLDQYDFGNWNNTFNVPPEKWEYTPNTMGYHDGYILDMTGMGVDDVCHKKIRIPVVNRDDWIKWTDLSGNKLLRFWKLKQKGYTTYDNDTENYVVKTYRKIGNPQTIKVFYCIYVMGAEYDFKRRMCINVKPSSQCDNCKTFVDNFKSDFGDYWSLDMVPPLQDMIYGSVNCSMQRSVELM